MARFRYQMQNILSIKVKLEEQEKQNFALARRKLNEEEAALEALHRKRDELAENSLRIREDKIDVLELKEDTAARKYMEEQIKQQHLKVRIAEKNLDSARLKMQRATQERKVHEKLKEKEFEDFLLEESRKEAKEIDELTSYVYGQKKG